MTAAAGVFAALNGANDGASLTSLGLTVRGLSPWLALTALGASVAAVPFLFGTAVASTLTARLVAFDGTGGSQALLVAIGTAILITFTLSSQGLPTSITLALIGGIAGAGVGAGLTVSWSVIVLVLAAAAISPTAGALVSNLVARGARRVPAKSEPRRKVRRAHALAFTAVCLAYGANDGQKIVAVFAFALGAHHGYAGPDPLILLVGAVLFIAGGMLGLRRFARTVGSGVAPTRPEQAVVTEASVATIVLAVAAAGAPVSMTQSAAGGLVGTAWSVGPQRVRWRLVLRIGVAWALTLPSAFGLAAVTAYAAEILT
ncbi:inorganic phosphate transporter [Streptomyces sp. NPDC019396]|uniref:inorganic phosphate transporter n=1 Tax=Streptomyces sp. NPDC019396 TaxID=3154687 RepID=UPI0033CB4B11